MMSQFGQKIKQLREANQFLQKQVAVKMEIDPPMLSKIESGDRKAKKDQVYKFAKVLGVNRDELLVLWLADQVIDVLADERLGSKAIRLAEEKLNTIL